MRTTSILTALSLSTIFALAAACGGEAGAPPATPAGPSAPANPAVPGAPGAEPKTFAEQVTLGRKLFADNCASCHKLYPALYIDQKQNLQIAKKQEPQCCDLLSTLL